MCFAVKFTHKNQKQKTVYVSKDAMIPVIKSDGGTELVRWGRAKTDEGKAFPHHCARLESIEAGEWDWLHPRGCNLAIDEYADYGTDGKVHWHKVHNDFMVRGALLNDEGVFRAYVVTIPAPVEALHMYKGGRMPKVISL